MRQYFTLPFSLSDNAWPVFFFLPQGALPEAGATPLGEGEEEEDITAQLPDVPTAEPTTQGTCNTLNVVASQAEHLEITPTIMVTVLPLFWVHV